MNRCRNYEDDDEICKQCSINHMENHNSCYERNVTMNENRNAAEKQQEAVNHPSHYSQSGRRECIEEMRLMFGDAAVKQWCVMTAYKYAYRAGNKEGNSAEQDCAKREWYLNYAENM